MAYTFLTKLIRRKVKWVGRKKTFNATGGWKEGIFRETLGH